MAEKKETRETVQSMLELQTPFIDGCKISLNLNERETRQCLKIYIQLLLKPNENMERDYPDLFEMRKEFARKLNEFIAIIEKEIIDDVEYARLLRQETWLENHQKSRKGED